jgi:hypothetical protein
MGKIILYCKNNCYHSDLAAEIANKLKQINNLIKIKINFFNNDEQPAIFSKINSLNNENNFLGNHRTCPIILYKKSKSEIFFIGGNDVFQNIIKLAKSSKVSNKLNISNEHIDNYNLLNTEGQKRLYCFLLKYNF